MIEAIEEDLKASIQRLDPETFPELVKMIEHHFGWTKSKGVTGKRFRPLLLLLCCRGAGNEWRHALPAASAIEFIHNFSLIHDDIEDSSETRRGRITLWKKWGIPQAINTGDTVFSLARLIAYRLIEADLSLKTVFEVIQTIDLACLKLTQGQYLDLALGSEVLPTMATYFEMISGKTAALLGASASIGAQLGGAKEDTTYAYSSFGQNLGLAFQISDDILGVWGVPEETGKPAGQDLLLRKNTLPILYGLENSDKFVGLWEKTNRMEANLEEIIKELTLIGARDYAESSVQQYSEAALESLEKASPTPPTDEILKDLTLSLIHRKS